MNTEVTLKINLDAIINELPVDMSWVEEHRYESITDTSISIQVVATIRDNSRVDIDVDEVVIDLCQAVRRKFAGAIYDSEKWIDACTSCVMQWSQDGLLKIIQDDQQTSDEYSAESKIDDLG